MKTWGQFRIVLFVMICLSIALNGLGRAADYSAPVISVFSLPATSTSSTVPVTLTATDDVGVTGYCLTETGQQVQDAGRKTMVVTLAISGITQGVLIGSVQSSLVLPAGVQPLKMAASGGGVDISGSVAWATAWNNAPLKGASITGSTIKFGAATLSGIPAGNLLTLSLTAPVGMTVQQALAGFSSILLYDSNDNAISGASITVSGSSENATQCPLWSSTLPVSYLFAETPQTVAVQKTLYAFAKDAAGNVSDGKSASTTITLPDSQPPVVNSFTMPPTSVTAKVTISSFSASDNIGVTGYCLAEQNSPTGCAWSTKAPGSYTFSGISTGVAVDKTLYAFAQDAAGNVSQAVSGTVTITIPDTADTKAPVIAVFTLPGVSSVATVPITAFTATDNVGVTGYCVSEKNAAAVCVWQDTAPTQYVFAGLTPGVATARTLYAFARDAAGNVSAAVSATTVITIPDQSDTTPPVVTSFSIPAAFTSAQVPVITFSASDNVAVSGYCLRETNSADGCSWSTVPPANYTFSISADGIYDKSLFAFARDLSGNISAALSATVKITIDTTPPVLTVSSLPSGSYTNNATLNVSGKVSDAVSGIKLFTVNGKSVAINPDHSFSTLVNLVDGENSILTTAIDAMGNSTSDLRTVIFKSSLPKLVVTVPSDNSATILPFVEVTGSIDPLSTVTVRVNNGNVQAAAVTGEAFSATVNLVPGINTIEIVASDLAGNSNSAKRTITFDSETPALSVNTPEQDVTIRDGKITISGSASSISAVTVKITAAGVDYSPVLDKGAFSQDLTFSAEKLYPVTITATNEVGKSSSVTRNINYTKGLVTINNGASYTSSNKVSLGLDYYPSAASIQLFYNNKSWTKPMPFVAKAAVILPSGDGIKTVMVRFIDGAGQVLGTYNSSIVLDTKAPVGGIAINGGAAVTNNRTVTLVLPAADVNPISGMQLRYDGSSSWSTVWEPYQLSKSITLPDGDGAKQVTVRFRDAAGLISPEYSAAITFKGSWVEPGITSNDVVVNNGATFTSGKVVTLSMTATGERSWMSFSFDGTNWTKQEKFVTKKKITLPAGDGLKTIFVRFADSSQVLSDTIYKVTVTLDSKAPVGTVSINGGAYATSSSQVTLAFSAADINGVTEMLISYDPAVVPVWEPFSFVKNVTLPAGAGTKKVTVKFQDSAGKISAAASASIVVQ